MARCLTDEQIEGLATGTSAGCSTHLAECATCREAVETARANELLARDLRGIRPAPKATIAADDDTLLSRLPDDAALTQLLERHLTTTREQLRRSGFDDAQLEDILHVVCVEAFLDGVPAQANLHGWYAWLDEIVRRATAPLHATSCAAMEETMATEQTAMDDIIAQAGAHESSERRDQLYAQLEQALAELPHEYQEAVRRFDMQSDPAQKAAVAIGRSEPILHMYRACAHARLRKQLLT